MAQVLRQSTQVIVVIGPFVDVTDGFTPETGVTLSGADEAELLKANTTTTTDISGNTIAAITGCDGYYGVTLTTTDTNTVGPLTIMVNDDSVCLPVLARFQVIEEAAYDAIYAASADPKADINVASIDANAITATSIQNDAFTAAKFASDVTTEFQSGLATAAALDTVDNFLDTEIAAIKAKTDSLTFTVAGVLDANVTHWLGVGVSALLDEAAVAAAVWGAAAASYTTAGTFGKLAGQLTFTVANMVDANIQYVNDVQVNGTGAGGDEWGP